MEQRNKTRPETFSEEQYEIADITIEEGMRRGRVALAEAFAAAGKSIAAVVRRMFERQNFTVDMVRRNKGAHAVR
jgi:hypothetical protein